MLAEKAEKATTEGHVKILHQTTRTLVGMLTKLETLVKYASGKAIFKKEAHSRRPQSLNIHTFIHKKK